MKPESILKVLTDGGAGSRRKMADAIRQGRVTINGVAVEDFRHPVNRDIDHIALDGKPVALNEKRAIYLLLNKPAGILSTTGDARGRRTVIELLPGKYRIPGVYPVGRLDRESTGLLLMTNDGELAYRLTHPRFEHEKEYYIHIDGKLKPDEKEQLQRGITLEDGKTSPASVREVTSTPPFNYSITIHEGRKRQVRRMLACLGYRVLALKRVRMGNLKLGNLKEGEIRELSRKEVRGLIAP